MIDIDFEDEDLIVSMDENFELEVKYHRELEGLDYDDANHTGFMPSRKENLEDVDSQASNDDVDLFGNDGTKPSKISITDLQDRILGSQTVARAILSIDSSNYIITLTTYDRNNHVINTSQIDLPEEYVVIGGRYDSVNKALILTLQNGTEITIPVGDLINGLQEEITANNPLSSDLVDDTNQVHKFVSAEEKAQITTNKNDILAIKDGTSINSFSQVESELDNLSNGKQDTIDSTHKLDADLIDDSNSTNKFTNATEKASWNAKQDSLSGSSSVDITSNVVSVKQTYIDSQFLTNSEMNDLIEEVYGSEYTL